MNETGEQYLSGTAVTFGNGFGMEKPAEQRKGFFVQQPKPAIYSLEPFGTFKQVSVPKFGFDKIFAGQTAREYDVPEIATDQSANASDSSSASTDQVRDSGESADSRTTRSESSSAASTGQKLSPSPPQFSKQLTPPQGDAWQNDDFYASESMHQEQQAYNATPSCKDRENSIYRSSPQAPAYSAVQNSVRLPDSLMFGASQRFEEPTSFAALAGQISASSGARLNIQGARLQREADELHALLTKIRGSISAAQRQARARDDELHDFISVMHRSKRSTQSQKALLAVVSWLCLLGGVLVLLGV